MAELDVVLRPAWRHYWLGLALTAALLLAALGSALGLIAPGGLADFRPWLLAALALLVFVALQRFSWKFTLDNTRVSRHYGLISRNQQSVRIKDLRSIELDQGILQRLLGIGDLAFYSAGSDSAEVRFAGIRDPSRWRDAVNNAMDQVKDAGNPS